MTKCPICGLEPVFVGQYQYDEKKWYVSLVCKHGAYSINYTSVAMESKKGMPTEEEKGMVLKRWDMWCVAFDNKTSYEDFRKLLVEDRGF